MAVRGEGFIMRSVEEYLTLVRLADPAREIRPRLSAIQKKILMFVGDEGPTPYGEVRKEVMGTPTPSRKASFSRSVRGLLEKGMVRQAKGELMLHPSFVAFMEEMAKEGVNNKGLKVNRERSK